MFVYLMLSELNQLRHIENTFELADIFVQLASTRADIAECAAALFPRSYD